ncbi:cell division protein SepF [Crocosphaera sp. XPORK-15E]|uniref:cell division protein SepF n=1 Tax=Crocosphaera sp. XPORK-15E TaxID=3110247 RepID=UPI002B20758F|nr:cell division protein SepF [Crocosphaera sp. XPORK-15E]MEA5534841.1 cell division protein SepF [Crocosphaera sp. XPORK-15E]
MILKKLRDWVGSEDILETEEDSDYDSRYEEIYGNLDSDTEGQAPMPVAEEAEKRPWRQPIGSNLNTEPTMGTNKNNVISMHGIANSIAEVVVVEPHSFDEMPQVIETLRERKSVVLNLNAMEPDEAQRAVDFVAGGTYAIDGHQERIGESIFLFTPNCVKVSTLSGTVHDVPDVSSTYSRSSTPSPGWGADVNRLVQ